MVAVGEETGELDVDALQSRRLLRRRSRAVDRRNDEDDRAVDDYLPRSGRPVHCGIPVHAADRDHFRFDQ